LEPYSDIGGPGVSEPWSLESQSTLRIQSNFANKIQKVYMGFIGTAWFVVALVVANYLFAFDPAKNPFSTGSDDGIPGSWSANPVDELVLSACQYTRTWLFSIAGNWLLGSTKAWFPRWHEWLCNRPRPKWEAAFTKVST